MTAHHPPVVLLDTHAHVVHSAVVGDDYELDVWLPPGYDSSSTRYPVLYVLDAPMAFGLAAQSTMISMFAQVVPEMIVVGIGQPLSTAYAWGPNRARDYAPVRVPDDDRSGHAAAFGECLRTELVPFVDQEYRTDSHDRGLWGHSFGGVFALHSLLERPPLFTRFIATSPAVVEQGLAMLDPSRWPAPGSSLPARLFVSIGSADQEYRPHVEPFLAELAARAYADLRVESAVLPGHGHVGAAPAGFLAGLRSVFAPLAPA